MIEVIVILSVFIFIAALVIIYFLVSRNLKSYKIKIDEAEFLLNELLNEKYDLLVSIEYIITSETDVDNKVFTNLKSIKKQNISTFDFDKKLVENYDLIKKIKDDYSEISKNQEFNKIGKDIYNLDEKLEATKTFYNKYVEVLNNLINKFPIKIVAKTQRLEEKKCYEIR